MAAAETTRNNSRQEDRAGAATPRDEWVRVPMKLVNR